MLKCQVLGYVGEDAVIRQANGDEFVSFSVAHSEKYINQKGEKVEKTEWVNVTYSGTKIAQYIKKGDRIYVEGYPSFNLYNDAQNKVKYSFNLRATSVEFAGSKEKESNT